MRPRRRNVFASVELTFDEESLPEEDEIRRVLIKSAEVLSKDDKFLRNKKTKQRNIKLLRVLLHN